MPGPRVPVSGYWVMVLGATTRSPHRPSSRHFVQNGGTVVAYRAGRALEDELFGSLTPAACQRLISYANELHGDLIVEHLRTSRTTRPPSSRSGTRSRTPASWLPNAGHPWSGGAHPKGWLVRSISWMEDVARPSLHRTCILRSGLPCADGPGIRVGPLMDHVDIDLRAIETRNRHQHRLAAARHS